uniref:F-box domain-containing protein n=1 Tax=Chenopodium quinoa TaxID=63459 RepID=A0A803L2T4_CHEQI
MDNLPVEVIGNILSQLGAARDVVIASTSCQKWREAWRNHLHSLLFDSSDWPLYHDFPLYRLEILITQTIFQTRGLQRLSILMNDVDEFSAAPVVAWLLYTRDSLRELYYNARTIPSVNILEKCGRHKLEVLALAHNSIIGVEPSYQRFPQLRSLLLTSVSISALDLSLLLNICPKLEVLKLINPDIVISDNHTTLELYSTSLKDVYMDAISMDKVILEGDHIEKLHLKDCTLEMFLLVGKGGLRIFRIDDVSVLHFDIDEVVDLEAVSVCFPRLKHLSLSYERDSVLHYGLPGSSCLENVAVLELGWTVINDLFIEWLSGLLERCPNLKKLIIYGAVSGAKTHDECNALARFTSSIVQLMRIHSQVEVLFEFE